MPKTSPNPNDTRGAAPLNLDVGPIPTIEPGGGRVDSAANLQTFISRYFPDRPPGGPVMQRFQTALLNQNPDLPDVHPSSPAARLLEAVILWALLTGRRRAVLLAGDRPTAIAFIRGLAHTLATNALLVQEWPEVCIPIRHAVQLGNGGEGQTYDGQPTNVEIAAERLRLPSIVGARPKLAQSHVPGAFVCTTFHSPQYDLRVLTLPTAADAA